MEYRSTTAFLGNMLNQKYIPESRFFLIGNLSGFETLVTENAGGKECVTVSTSELYFERESLHESSKVPV